MSRTLYHSTSRAVAASIEEAGFRDAPFLGTAEGVCVSDRPLDAADGVARSADVCFALAVPAGFDLAQFEIEEEGRPPDAYREWLVPAAVLNGWPRRRHRDDDEQEPAHQRP